MKRAALAGTVCAGLALCWWGAGLHAGLDLRALSGFARGLFPPDLSPAFLVVVAVAMVRTLGIAVAGTVLAVGLGLPLGLLATPALWRRGPLSAGERPGPSAALSWAFAALARFLRAVPDLVWALFFVVGFGLGPLPGTLAVGINTAGVLARVYADLFEAVPPGPVLSLHATGASRLQAFAAAIWPQAAPSVLAYTLYAFECNVRAAAVLGFVGAGGIGQEINLSMRLFEYGQVTTLLGAFVALVLVTDAVSRRARGRLRRNGVHGSGVMRTPLPLETRPGRPAMPARMTALLGVVLLAVAFQQAGFLNLAVPAHLGRFVAQLFPPDLSPAFLLSLIEPVWQTVAVSILGTAIGIALGALLALPAAATLMRDERDPDTAVARALRTAAYLAARFVLALLRSIPELVWVLLCIVAFGLGPFAGAAALGLHTAGVLGKLYAETLEELPEAPGEELRAIGAGPMQRLFWALWPQARETLLSYTLLRWETNLRLSTVVGLVGGGGLGLALYNDVQLGWYPQAATLVILIYLLVVATDFLAGRLRSPPAAGEAPASALDLVTAG